jgi:hypothetical protein
MFISGHLWRCTFAAALSSANREVAVTRAYAASMHQLLRVVPWVAGGTFAGLLLVAGLLHLFPRLGRAGRRVAEACTRAPGLDWLVVYFTVVPLIVGAIIGGWAGLAGAVIGQVAAVLVWSRLHELFNRDWVNVSRQKFEGLVGHDLIWCLYCDWMTGVWSLGTEMLRNVESFWCPIRFYNGKKCENCAIDFPDVNAGWVPADGTMSEVANTIERMYGDGDRRWFEKRVQISVRGRELPVEQSATSAE